MRLDLDCIRDILLTIEENTGYNEHITLSERNIITYDLLKEYDSKKVMYHIIQK